MVRFLNLFLFAVLVAIPGPSRAGSDLLHRADTPGWVTEVPLPEVNPELLAQTRDGVYFLLADKQVRWQDGKRQSYLRTTMKVLDRAGLEFAARVTREVNPEFETLTLHRLDVIRNGTRMALRDRTDESVFRRESEFERGMLDGVLTVHLEIADLKVGDIVDLAFSWDEAPRVPGLTHFFSSSLEWSVPVGRTHARVLWPRDVPAETQVSYAEVQHTRTETDDVIVETWLADDVPAVYIEGDIPNWYPLFGTVTVSGLTWRDVAGALVKYYQQPQDLPTAFAAEIDAIMARETDEPGRIAMALRLVQDRIRYVGIEIGSGAYYARSPATVLERGFGDCKDKAVLLKTVLNRMGIEAEVALVNLSTGQSLSDRLPSPFRFDHMIVRVGTADGPLWLDPTLSHQGGRDEGLAQADYGYALPLAPGVETLEKIDIPVPTAPQVRIEEEYRFGEDGLDLTVTSVYLNRAADNMRYKLATSSQYDLFKGYFDYYAGRYPGLLQNAATVFTDDLETNRLEIKEAYRLPKPALEREDLITDFPFGVADFTGLFSQENGANRTNPLWQPYPVNREHLVKVFNAPTGLTAPDPVTVENDHFRYTMRSFAVGRTMQLRWNLETRSNMVPPGEVAAYVADLRDLNDNATWYWNLTPPEKPETPGSFLERLLEGN